MTDEYDNENTEEIAETPDEPQKESISDTVLRAYEQLENENVGDPEESVDDETASEDATTEATTTETNSERQSKRRVVDFEKAIEPPHVYDAKGKEAFRTWPKEVQQNMRRLADQWNGHTKKMADELKGQRQQVEHERNEVLVERQRYSGLETTLLPYAKEWSKRGISTSQGIAELAAFNDLVERDSEQAILALARSRGVEIEIKNPKSKQGVAQQPQLDYQQIYSQVKQDLTRDQQKAAENYQRTAVANEVDSALSSLQNELNEGGQYIYPDLHDNDFHKRLHPAIVGLKHANPNLPWTELLRRAYRSVDGRVIPRKSTAKPNLNGTLDAARRAASSKPGSSNGTMDMWKAKPGETHATSASRAWDLLTKAR